MKDPSTTGIRATHSGPCRSLGGDAADCSLPIGSQERGWVWRLINTIRKPVCRRILGLRRGRTWVLVVGHAWLFVLVLWLSVLIRFDLSMSREGLKVFFFGLPWIVGVKLAVFFALGHYHGWWRYVTFADLVALIRVSLLSSITIVVVDYFISSVHLPRSVVVLDWLLTVIVFGSLRSSWRILREHFLPAFKPRDFHWAVVVGTDDASGVLAHQIQSHPQLPYRIRGFVSTNGEEETGILGQIPILGSVEKLGELATSYRITDVLITAGTITGREVRHLMERCAEAGLNLKIVPGLEDRLSGDHRIPIRNIEIADLLRRAPVNLDSEAIGKLLAGRTIMVTGAGGSIGSELCRQVMQFDPQALVLVGRGENRIFHIERELRAAGWATAIHPCIADVTDKKRMHYLFQRYRPAVVLHAAAHKHVTLMEINAGEAVKNNVLGTSCVADLADAFGVDYFVLISTDKAVRPTTVMGASKRIAETYVHALSQESDTCFTVVRFGNVLGSEGSVVPIFQEQIRRGGPITITDPRMTRFFMTIPEACQLVLQAAGMGRGGEIFVLDMGAPVKIIDLAKDLVRLSGLPEDSIDITYIGIRPGEKLDEELYSSEEETLPTLHPKLRVAYHGPCSLQEVRRSVADLLALADGPDEAIRNKLREIVPEFTFSSSSSSSSPSPHRDHLSLSLHTGDIPDPS